MALLDIFLIPSGLEPGPIQGDQQMVILRGHRLIHERDSSRAGN
jgi:hypothetical protein